MQEILNKEGFICDMDGVIYHGSQILDGVKEFVTWMIENDKKFVFLTNSPERTPHELSMKLERMGLTVDADHFYTSAMATAEFLRSQAPGCTAYGQFENFEKRGECFCRLVKELAEKG